MNEKEDIELKLRKLRSNIEIDEDNKIKEES